MGAGDGRPQTISDENPNTSFVVDQLSALSLSRPGSGWQPDRFHSVVLEQMSQMQVAGEHQDLLALLRELHQRPHRSFGSQLSKFTTTSSSTIGSSTPRSEKSFITASRDRQEDLLAGAVAEMLDLQRLSVLVVDHQMPLSSGVQMLWYLPSVNRSRCAEACLRISG